MPGKKKKVTKKTTKSGSAKKETKTPKKALKASKKQTEDVTRTVMTAVSEGGGAQISVSTPTVSSAAIATGSSLKNFKHHPDIENFYRFVFENDLRFESLAILDEMLTEKRNRKELKAAKQKAH